MTGAGYLPCFRELIYTRAQMAWNVSVWCTRRWLVLRTLQLQLQPSAKSLTAMLARRGESLLCGPLAGSVCGARQHPPGIVRGRSGVRPVVPV